MSLLRPHSGLISFIQRMLDVGLIAFGLAVCSAANYQDWNALMTFSVILVAPVFLAVGEALHLYASWRLKASEDEFKTVFIVWFVTVCAVIVAAFLAKVSVGPSRLTVVAWILTVPALLILPRVAIRAFLKSSRRRGMNTRTACVVGATPLAQQVIQSLRRIEGFDGQLIHIYEDRSRTRIGNAIGDASNLAGNFNHLMTHAHGGQMDYVFIALPMNAQRRISDLVRRLANTTASVYVVPDLFTADLMRTRWSMLGDLPLLSVYESPFDEFNSLVKRAEDLLLGGVILAVLAIPMLFVALAIKITSKGPVLFKQNRYGLNGRVVKVCKFRTMSVVEEDAAFKQAQLGDSRVTRLGRFLRSTSIDELPQLVNVLGGSLSLVGPRPHPIALNEQFRPLVHGYMLRHKVKPGITGWAQVNGWRGETNTLEKMQRRVEHDLEYVQNWSLWLDLKILVLTIAAVFSKKNAY